MPKWIGNRFGSVVPIGPGSNAGSAVYSLFDQYYASRQDGWFAIPEGITATGGVISDYTDSGNVYRAHVFTSSGTFAVSSIGDFTSAIEYLIVGGGGGGGYEGGGGAGGMRTNQAGHPLAPNNPNVNVATNGGPNSDGNYPIVVGAGAGAKISPAPGNNGVPSTAFGKTSLGGGGGGKYNNTPGKDGGSGGGGYSSGGGGTAGSGGPDSQGQPGGDSGGGGGGGAGGAGTPGNAGKGGLGLRTSIAGPSYPIGTPGPAGTGGYVAGGGSGAPPTGSSNTAGPDGGGGGRGYNVGFANPLSNGIAGTGGGGGGGWQGTAVTQGGGGSGLVVVKYQIGEIAATAKATGGSISFYGSKTIHTFTNTGTFTAPTPLNPTALSVECFVVAGGGGGGAGIGGGGGAGGLVYKPGIPITLDNAYSISIGAGGASNDKPNNSTLIPGVDTTALGLTAKGGGGGGSGQGGTQAGSTGGSAGGTGSSNGTNPGPATQPGTSNPGATINAGNVGGPGASTTAKGGGGGGAGGAATGEPMPSTGTAGIGGLGRQIPPAFRNPVSATSLGATGPGSGDNAKWWFAGGGGGGAYNPAPATGGPGGGPGGPYAGGGAGGTTDSFSPAQNGLTNTGGGAGGGGYNPGGGKGGNGGSGIVLIAYPS